MTFDTFGTPHVKHNHVQMALKKGLKLPQNFLKRFLVKRLSFMDLADESTRHFVINAHRNLVFIMYLLTFSITQYYPVLSFKKPTNGFLTKRKNF